MQNEKRVNPKRLCTSGFHLYNDLKVKNYTNREVLYYCQGLRRTGTRERPVAVEESGADPVVLKMLRAVMALAQVLALFSF